MGHILHLCSDSKKDFFKSFTTAIFQYGLDLSINGDLRRYDVFLFDTS